VISLIELRIAACAAMLLIAAIIDIKKREVPDKIWVGFGAFGALLAALEFTGLTNGIFGNTSTTNASNQLVGYFLGIGLMAPIGYVIYKTGLFGGADSKALIAIAVLVPSFGGGIISTASYFHEFAAFTILTNALIISMVQLVFNSARNTIALTRGERIFEGIEESTPRKILAFVIGYRSKDAHGYLFPMEGIDELGKRMFSFNPAKYDEFIDDGEEDVVVATEVDGESGVEVKENNDGIWVTQALPFIVYIAIGFVIAVTFGDLLGLVFRQLF
jgi:archaeal preflagellin peptidase FlaK